jgi:rhombotail lipoprotein
MSGRLSRFVVLLVLFFIGGCATPTNYSSHAIKYSDLMQNRPVQSSKNQRLSLPVRVGVIFVPKIQDNQRQYWPTDFSGTPGSISDEKRSLMKDLSVRCGNYDFIESVNLIPSEFLMSRANPSDLEYLKFRFGIDVIMYISLIQTQNVKRDLSAIGYLTGIGALGIKGEKCETNTWVDTVAIHIPTNSLMFRVSGTSRVESKSTPVNLSAQTKQDSRSGFKQACENLITNLDVQFQTYKTRIAKFPEDYEIAAKPGSGAPERPTCLSRFPYSLPLADTVLVKKTERRLYLKRQDQILKTYEISLGGNPVGPKVQEGDRRTPEGRYVLDWRKSNSSFYKSIHVSYPSKADMESARSRGVRPGGMIMIHGTPKHYEWTRFCPNERDWTNGCIAVSNRDMDEIWSVVPDGTPIEIHP